MAVLFPKSYQVIRRGKGNYVNGIFVLGPDPSEQIIALNIQPASVGDYTRTASTMAGRRVSAMCRAFAQIDAGLNVAGSNGYPGDIILYENQRWLVIGSAQWNTLDDADTAHMRYMIALEAEHGVVEALA